jgi:hypothetical protein
LDKLSGRINHSPFFADFELFNHGSGIGLKKLDIRKENIDLNVIGDSFKEDVTEFVVGVRNMNVEFEPLTFKIRGGSTNWYRAIVERFATLSARAEAVIPNFTVDLKFSLKWEEYQGFLLPSDLTLLEDECEIDFEDLVFTKLDWGTSLLGKVVNFGLKHDLLNRIPSLKEKLRAAVGSGIRPQIREKVLTAVKEQIAEVFHGKNRTAKEVETTFASSQPQVKKIGEEMAEKFAGLADSTLTAEQLAEHGNSEGMNNTVVGLQQTALQLKKLINDVQPVKPGVPDVLKAEFDLLLEDEVKRRALQPILAKHPDLFKLLIESILGRDDEAVEIWDLFHGPQLTLVMEVMDTMLDYIEVTAAKAASETAAGLETQVRDLVSEDSTMRKLLKLKSVRFANRGADLPKKVARAQQVASKAKKVALNLKNRSISKAMAGVSNAKAGARRVQRGVSTLQVRR